MLKKDVIAFFGTQKAVAEALGITRPAISVWGETVPSSRQEHVRLVMRLEQKKRDEAERRRARKASKEIAP